MTSSHGATPTLGNLCRVSLPVTEAPVAPQFDPDARTLLVTLNGDDRPGVTKELFEAASMMNIQPESALRFAAILPALRSAWSRPSMTRIASRP